MIFFWSFTRRVAREEDTFGGYRQNKKQVKFAYAISVQLTGLCNTECPSLFISGSGSGPLREGLLSLVARQIYRRNFPPETALLTRRQSSRITQHET